MPARKLCQHLSLLCILLLALSLALLATPPQVLAARDDMSGSWQFDGDEIDWPHLHWSGVVQLTQSPFVGDRAALRGTVFWVGNRGDVPGSITGWEDFQDGASGTDSHYNRATRRIRYQGYRTRDAQSSIPNSYLAITTYQADITADTCWMLNGAWGDPAIPGRWQAYRVEDCNTNGITDALEIRAGLVTDANANCIPDVCEPSCSTPQIALQPTSATICAGSSVNLVVIANGTPAPAFQWRLNGVGIPGATALAHSINNASPDQSGSYDVQVSNTCGSIISDAAVVVIWPLSTGDVNGDGLTDGADIGSFLTVLMNTPSGPPDLGFCAADMNADSRVNYTDVPLFVTRLLGS